MILHNNGTFLYNNRLSFRLPNGMAIDYSHEVEGEDDFRLIAPDGSFKIALEFVERENDPQSFIEELFEEFEQLTVLEPQRVVEASCGLVGYATRYALTDEICEEIAFPIPGTPRALLDIVFWRRKDELYDRDLYTRAKEEILAGLAPC